jgi:hypothetical protein
MTSPRPMLYLLFFVLLAAAGWAQHQEDPLSPDEVTQIRDAAQAPEQRLKLYVNFAAARLDAAARSQTDPKVKNPAQEVHDHLQDFLNIYDELDENIDTYADRQDDLRKALKTVIEGDTEFQAKLRALEASTTATPQEKNVYQFVLTSALNDVDDGAQDHRELLAEQEDAAKHRKKKEKSE